jgi:hypothetical protein
MKLARDEATMVLGASSGAGASRDNASIQIAEASHATAHAAWVLLPAEAMRRGFKGTRSFRRWCRRHRVEIRKDGRREWISPLAVDRVVSGLGEAERDPLGHAASEAVARFLGGR